MKLATYLDMLGNELRNARIQNLASAPTTLGAGQVYYDTGATRIKMYQGSSFTAMITALDSINALTAPTASVPMGGQKITGVGTGVATTDAATLSNKITDFALPTSSVPLNGQKITGQGTGVAATDGATLSNKVTDFAAPTSALNMNNQKVTALANGTAATDAVTYGQMMSLVNGMDWKNSARVATAAALPANTYSSGAQTLTATSNAALVVDGVTVAANDRVLVKNEATATNNGIFVVTATGSAGAPYVLTRASDANLSADLTANTTIAASEGTVNADTWWQITTNDTIVLDTTALTWASIGQSVTYTAGNGLTLVGQTFSVNYVSGGGLTLSGAQLTVDSAVVAKKYITPSAIGDGSASSFTITHGLNNANPHVTIWEAGASGYMVIADVQKSSVNAVIVSFAQPPASGAYLVEVIG